MSRPDYTLPLDQLPDPLPIEPLTKPFDVTITPPGSKSITCRAYVLAALANGESKIIRPLRADDTDLLLKSLCTLGAEARWEGEDVFIKGVGGRFPRGGEINLGDGGTPTRFMIACACLAAEPVTVDGSKRMRERPIAEGVDMLRRLGAKIEYVEAEGRLPVRVSPSEKFVGGEIEVGQTQSSQFISALMLISPALSQGIQLHVHDRLTSASYVELTRYVLKQFDAKYRRGFFSQARTIIPHQWLGAVDFEIHADASSAIYWSLAAKIVDGSRMLICGLHPHWSPQPDFGAIGALDRFGGISHPDYDQETGLVVSSAGRLHGQRIDCDAFPDGSIALAIASASADDASRLTGLRTLRVKETDRIAALANELRKVDCVVASGDDWIEIRPPDRAARRATSANRLAEPGAISDAPIIIDTYNDHRMAMAFAVLGLAAPGGRRLAIRNPACVAKSYPTFWRDFAMLYQ